MCFDVFGPKVRMMMERLKYCLFCWMCFIASSLAAQPAHTDSASVVPGIEYRHNSIYTFFFGKHYRAVWESPVRVPVYSFRQQDMRPVKEGGRLETKSLHMVDTAGREYVARSVNKDLSKVLPPWWAKTFIGNLFRDQCSANEPYAALVVAPLAKAAQVPHADPRLYLLPDDSAIKGFPGFIDRLVLVEEKPGTAWASSFGRVEKVAGTEEMMQDRFGDEHYTIDARTYLRARLLDLVIGDWSRHEDQYRWMIVRTDSEYVYVPIPRDRDHAFYRNDGVVNRLSLLVFPASRSFGKKIEHIHSLTYMGRNLDKLILPQLSWNDWKGITDSVAASLSDSVITNAVKQLPRESYGKDGQFIEGALKQRRDQLISASRKFYKMINKEVSVFGSDGNEMITLDRDEKGVVTVTVSSDDCVILSRTFLPSVTKTIRIYGFGGSDVLKVNNAGSHGPLVIFYGGAGENHVHGTHKKRRLKVYDVKPQKLLEYYTEGSEKAGK